MPSVYMWAFDSSHKAWPVQPHDRSHFRAGLCCGMLFPRMLSEEYSEFLLHFSSVRLSLLADLFSCLSSLGPFMDFWADDLIFRQSWGKRQLAESLQRNTLHKEWGGRLLTEHIWKRGPVFASVYNWTMAKQRESQRPRTSYLEISTNNGFSERPFPFRQKQGSTKRQFTSDRASLQGAAHLKGIWGRRDTLSG